MKPTATAFLTQIENATGLERTEAHLAARVALEALLPQLPDDLRAVVQARREHILPSEASPGAAVASALRESEERAATIARAVVMGLLETMGSDARTLLDALPPELRPDFAPTDKVMARTAKSRRPSMLGAHSQSIVRSDDPHADTRISSATGLVPQERTLAAAGPPEASLVNATGKNDRTLAGGRPGSTRPLVPSRDNG